MKKLYFMLTIILLLIATFIITTNIPKNYKINYKVNNIEVEEQYQKNTKDYHFLLKYKNTEYPFVVSKKYQKQRKILEKIKVIEDNKDTCLIITLDKQTQTLCSDKNGLKDYNLINSELYENNFKSQAETKIIKTYNKIDIYDLNSNYLIWNYKGYININKNNQEVLDIFKNENYSTQNTYQTNKYLIIPDYDSKYYFNKIYIFDTEKQLLNDINFDYEISYDLLYLGEVKNKLYFVDKKNKNEYALNLKKFELKKIKLKNEKIEIYQNEDWTTKSLKDVINKNITFTYYSSFNYKLIDNYLYKIIDNHNIKVSNQKITSIISSNGNNVYYLVGTKLYEYNGKNEKLLLEYKEWKFNYINQIFIFN